MSIRKRVWADGKHAWQVDLLFRRKRIRKQFATKADAKAFELEIRRRAREGTFLVDASKVAVSDLVPDYISTLEQRHERGASMTTATLQAQTGHLRNYIVGGVPIKYGNGFTKFRHGLGEYKFDEITQDAVTEFCEQLLEFGRSVKTVREIRNTLSGFLDYARRRKYIAINPARGMRMIANSAAKRKRKVSPPSKRLLAAIMECASETEALAIKFAALTGLRASEQWALRWHHIDFKRGYVSVETRVDTLTKTENVPKTQAGHRNIPVARDLLEELLKWRARSKFSGASELVFPNTAGFYRDHTAVRDKFYRYYNRAIMKWPKDEPAPPRPRWHDLRHFAVSCWIEAGLSPKAAQEFAGHASLQMTMDTYGHLFPSEQHQDTMNLIAEGAFGALSVPS